MKFLATPLLLTYLYVDNSSSKKAQFQQSNIMQYAQSIFSLCCADTKNYMLKLKHLQVATCNRI